MLPFCSAAATCSSPSSYSPQIFYHLNARAINPLRKALECAQDGFRSRPTNFAPQMFAEMPDQAKYLDSSIFSPYPNQSDDIVRGFLNGSLDGEREEEMQWLHPVADGLPSEPESLLVGTASNPEVILFADLPATIPSSGDQLPEVYRSLGQNVDVLTSSSSSGTVSATNTGAVGPMINSDTIELTKNGVLGTKANIENLVSGFGESIEKSVGKVESSVESTYNMLKSSISDVVARITESYDSVVDGLFTAASSSKQETSSQLAGFTSSLKENANGVGNVAIENLRRAIIGSEDALGKAASFFIYSYGSAKSLLPVIIRDTLDLSEEKALQVVRPVGSAFQQVYIVIEGLEKVLGLDPTDPVVQFVLLVCGSTTIGVSFWLLKYGGYSGGLTPEITLELLKNDKNAVLVDVRPEDLRERDGVPDLRRRARSKFASVNLPEIDVSVRKLLKSGKDVNDALTAAVIRNLKIVKDGSKVIIMDANGNGSKAIARSLRKLGVKNSYTLDGGFQSWAKSDLRVKELKPETTLTVLNEDAEAIIEEIKLNPALVIGYGLGITAAIYALLEWEKTLQIIGIIGLGQSLYRRLATYQDSEDLKKDVGLLLAPVQLGAQAFSWAATKMEPNKIGLPTSPSSTAVRDRVVQAAAKHESQPSDAEEAPVPVADSASEENLDLSEA